MQRLLDSERNVVVVRPELLYVLSDRRSGVAIYDQHDLVETCGDGVGRQEVDDGFAVFSNRGELLQSAVSTGSSCGQDH